MLEQNDCVPQFTRIQRRLQKMSNPDPPKKTHVRVEPSPRHNEEGKAKKSDYDDVKKYRWAGEIGSLFCPRRLLATLLKVK